MTQQTSPAIEIAGLRVEFETSFGRRVTAVDGLDLVVRQGEVVGLIGPNGAGKTTTIKVLMGFIERNAGEVSVLGEQAGSIQARRRIGYLPEVAVYYPFLTAREALRFYAALADIPRDVREQTIDELLELTGLTAHQASRLSGYSKGMLQRVGIAQAILGGPDLLILDEVTSGLDPVARYDVRTILMNFKAKGKTVFFSSHELSEVALLCDRIVLLDEGRAIEESALTQMLESAKCVVIYVKHTGPPPTVPAGVINRFAGGGACVYAVESWEAAKALQRTLEQQGATVERVEEQPPSLEDYFVRKLGHKTT